MGFYKMNGVTVVIPVRNEEGIILTNTKKLIKFLDKLKIPYELFICDNGSTDTTYSKGREIEKMFSGKVKFFSTKKRGVGLCFKNSIKESSYDFLFTFDIDLSINLNFMEYSLKLLKNYDVVIGSKDIGKEKRFLIRKFLSKVYILLCMILLDLKFSDYSPSGKAYRKNCIADMIEKLDDESFYTTQILFFLKRKKAKIIEIPVDCKDYRVSKFNIYREIFYRLRFFAETFLKFRILKKNYDNRFLRK